MNPGRILGVIAGIVILVAVFTLPFLALPSEFGANGLTLFSIAQLFLSNLGSIQQLGSQTLIALAYVLIVVFILLTIAGVVGFFPLGSGVIGIIAMAIITFAPLVIFPDLQLGLSSVGMGYFVAWAGSIVALGASFWKARVEKAPSVSVTVNAPPAPPPPPQTDIVVSPTITVSQTQISGEAKPVRPEEVLAARPVESPQLEPGETTVEEVAKTIDALKQKYESGEMSSEMLHEELGKLMYTDFNGKYWTVDFRTGHWVYHDGTKWIDGTPPTILKKA